MFQINLRETPTAQLTELPENELVDIVNEEDVVLGSRTLGECLRLGLLHREVTVFLRNSKDELLLQQRSKSDDWLPGKWTASCTGHVKLGEDPLAAAERELKEEVGISVKPVFLFKLVVPKIRHLDKIEYEVDIVFEACSDDTPRVDKTEVEKVVFLSPDDCKHFFKEKSEDITLDARLAFQRYALKNL